MVIFVDFVVHFYYGCLVVEVGHFFACSFLCAYFGSVLFTSETPTFMRLHMPGWETKEEFIFVVSRPSLGVYGSQHSSRAW